MMELEILLNGTKSSIILMNPKNFGLWNFLSQTER